MMSGLVCPKCHGRLIETDLGLSCSHCHALFERHDGIIYFHSQECPFPSETNQGALLMEDESALEKMHNFLLPIIRQRFPNRTRTVKILSIGCGSGIDVETLNDLGCLCYGIDIGDRVKLWPQRRHRDHLFFANALCLPFEDDFFDIVFSFGVIEHIGTKGDSIHVRKDYWEERCAFAREAWRVTRTEGVCIMSCVNRLFPIDPHHGANLLGIRVHLPFEGFLLSYGDFRRIFVKEAGFASVRPLPSRDFLAFKTIQANRWLKPMTGLAKACVSYLSRSGFLLQSPLNPLLVVMFEK